MTFDEYLNNQLETNPEFKKEYDALALEYEIKSQIIKARIEKNLTQKELADIIGLPQSHISRLESGNYNPSIKYLQKIAKGLGKELHIAFI